MNNVTHSTTATVNESQYVVISLTDMSTDKNLKTVDSDICIGIVRRVAFYDDFVDQLFTGENSDCRLFNTMTSESNYYEDVQNYSLFNIPK